ncbi:HAMP domain-containing histidine kinase [Phyllobacterium sp. 21LDTY02-6]|jgi:signal transduction histidine kinase|uniref:sensor histidine kinase n=1 Tax=unclassified Phyllobacterium TaxID=2638441 RepID=UPI0020215E64|nr:MULTISPECIES: HAMP domain-containing sensor histidine kinase [unclassified Phyllobacterium]MCO4316929.1 HAMP domain-containing histidine kinase [Phyllobacterium sp. 21LDTY02-6]MCX8281790.1 HAMP domain-containing sensor histidine kinase [Phyllobacterium sp. 0TCS1.6C]MCX8295325.1 HAMP domain-containing sensor histidine kinase [Phyllobacterium sp. 0TCS1.6A]
MASTQDHTENGDTPASARPLPVLKRLSGKLLLLTLLFGLIAEIMIFVPTIADMRMRWLADRLNTVAAASVVLAASDADDVPQSVQNDVLLATGTKAIALREKGASRLLAVADMPSKVARHIDMTVTDPVTMIRDAFDELINGGNRVIRVYGPIGDTGKVIELLTSDTPLRNAMLLYARNVALISLFISVITATLVFLAISRMLITPIQRMTTNMLEFAQAPDDPQRIITPDEREDELGIAQRELSSMQRQLQRTLAEQKHLADLGLAVSKINHDMRNILASAQLMSDHLAHSSDPAIQRFIPKLVRTIDRAVHYSQAVLAYGATQEAPPQRRRVNLHTIVRDVEDMLDLDAKSNIEFKNLVPENFEIDVDPDQFFRVISNLCRNSIEAMAADTRSDPAIIKRLTITAGQIGATSIIGVEDTGPGLPAKARDNLFTAFKGSARSGGTGLGLAIVHELVRAHGGTIELRDGDGPGTSFEIRIPDQPVSLTEWRSRRNTASH